MSLITSLEELKALGFRTGESQRESQSQTNRASGSGFGSVLKSSLGAVSEEMDTIFEDAARTYGISSRLLKAVAKAESNFNPKAVSKAGAVGVMQLMPGTAKSLGVSDSYDARQNIMGGAKYLKQNLDKFGDVRLALAAYNAGPNSVQKYGGIPPYQETQNYVKKIMGYLEGEPLQANKTVTTGGTKSSTDSRMYAAARKNSGFKAERTGGLNNRSGLSGSSLSNRRSLLTNAGSSSSLENLSLLNRTGSSASLGNLSLLNGSGSSASLGSLSLLDSSGSSASLGSLSLLDSSGSSASLGSLSLLNSTGSSTSLGNLNLLSSSGALTSSLLANASLSEDGDTVTMDKESFSQLVELVRIQMMMNAGKSVGDMSML